MHHWVTIFEDPLTSMCFHESTTCYPQSIFYWVQFCWPLGHLCWYPLDRIYDIPYTSSVQNAVSFPGWPTGFHVLDFSCLSHNRMLNPKLPEPCHLLFEVSFIVWDEEKNLWMQKHVLLFDNFFQKSASPFNPSDHSTSVIS